jgi:predicted flap endonuclease-1-like 5' DNA nuclease
MVAGIEPFATWFYPLAWYPTLVLLDAAVASRDSRFFLLGRPTFLATALAWSVPFWLVFELLNLRLGNWYYVFLPRDPVARWAGIVLSFATVIPAVLVSERALAALGLARGARIPPIRAGELLGWALQSLGVLMLALTIAWPGVFFPLAWGGVLLIVDPWVGRRDPERSLLADLGRGNPGRIARLLVGGFAIGLLWEVFNLGARGKWIYTVPGIEDWKLFEMPILGFLGFPFFALEAFAVWQALVVAGLAVPAEGEARSAPWRARTATALAALAFSAATIAAMHERTISSLVPTLADIGATRATLARAGIDDPWELAEADPDAVSAVAGVEVEQARQWVEQARLAALRGIGAANALALAEVGVGTVAELAASDPDRLAETLRSAGAVVAPARVRVWVIAARETARSGP